MKNDQQIIFGIRALIEAIDAGKEIDKVFLRKGLGGELYHELFALIRQHEVPFQFVPAEKINHITTKNHQGVVAFISAIEYKNIEQIIPLLYEQGRNPLILVLDQVSDVRNFGAIARTAECAGVDAIVVPTKGAAAINADAVKTSSGALHKINVCRVDSLNRTVKFLKDSGLQIIAATEKAADMHYKTDLTVPTAIVMGAEDTGISPEIMKLADQLVKIPMRGTIGSLNVSVAAGVLIYEVIRQRLSAGQ